MNIKSILFVAGASFAASYAIENKLVPTGDNAMLAPALMLGAGALAYRYSAGGPWLSAVGAALIIGTGVATVRNQLA